MISVELVCPCGSSGPFAPLFGHAKRYQLTEVDDERTRTPLVLFPARPIGALCPRCGRVYDDREEGWAWLQGPH